MQINLTREESIPYIDETGVIMQMIKAKVQVSVSNNNGETEEELNNKLDKLFNEQLNKVLASDNIYQKLKKQRDYLFETLKQELPKEKVKEVISYLKG